TGYGLDDRARFPAKEDNFLTSAASRMSLGLTQPPIRWVPGGREADHSPPSNAEIKNRAIPLFLYTFSLRDA
ncbi:hypothetical protein B7P43_G13890, partial [Cryptotermes secundus]